MVTVSTVKSVHIRTTINDLHQTHKPHFSIQKRRGFGDFLNLHCKETSWHNYRQQSVTAGHYTDRKTLLILQQYHKIKAWCGNKPLCTQRIYDLGKLEVNKVAPNTWTEHIQKLRYYAAYNENRILYKCFSPTRRYTAQPMIQTDAYVLGPSTDNWQRHTARSANLALPKKYIKKKNN